MQTVGKQCYIMSNNPSFIMLNVVKKFFTLLALHEQEGRVLFGVDLISCQKWAWTQGISWTSLLGGCVCGRAFPHPRAPFMSMPPVCYYSIILSLLGSLWKSLSFKI